MTFSEIKVFLKDLESTGIKFETISFELVLKAIDFSKKFRVSVYDAAYAVLAKEKGCDFYTADSKFVKAVNLPFVKHLSDYPS